MKRIELIGLIRESIGNVLLKEDMELSRAEDRRGRDDWNEKNLHSGDIGSQAHALFKHLRDEGNIDESYDVYDIIPMGDNFDMRIFAVKDDLDTQWMVGTEEQTHESAVDNLKDMVDSEGAQNLFSDDFITGSVNIGDFNRYLRGHLDDMIYEDPEGWLSDEARDLTDKQQDFIKYLNIKKERLEQKLQNADQDEEDEIQEQISEIEEKINDIEIELDDIKHKNKQQNMVTLLTKLKTNEIKVPIVVEQELEQENTENINFPNNPREMNVME